MIENFKVVNLIIELLKTLETKLDALSNDVKSHTPKDLFTSKEAARYLNIKMNWLDKLCSQEQLDYTQPGGKIRYFKKEDLDEYLKSRVRKSERKLEEEADEILFGNPKNGRL